MRRASQARLAERRGLSKILGRMPRILERQGCVTVVALLVVVIALGVWALDAAMA